MTTPTPTEVDALDDYSYAQMAKLCRRAIVTLTASPDQTVKLPDGREFTVQDLDRLRRAEQTYRRLAAEAAETTRRAGVAEFGAPTA